MENNILTLISDDLYSLWEIRGAVSDAAPENPNERLKTEAIDLVRRGKALCYVSNDLSLDDLILVSSDHCIELLTDEENWLVPDNQTSQIVRLTAADEQ